MNKRTLSAAVGAVVIVLGARPVCATGIPVVDVANLAQAVMQVSHDVTQISNQATQIAHQVQQINNQMEMLRSIGSSQFGALSGTMSRQASELRTILDSASRMQYALSRIQSQIDAIYPQDADWRTFDMSTANTKRQEWDNAITEANSVAMRTQSSLNRIQDRNTQIESLLREAQSENGHVRQMQINAQLNGQVAQALNDNAAVQATAARAQMLALQRDVAAREMAREQHRRMMQNFTSRGDPITPLTSFPPIAPHP